MITLNRQNGAWRLTAGSLLAFFLITVCPIQELVPAAMATPRQDLDRAQDLYDFAEFQQALELTSSLIDGRQLSGNDLRDAYVLRARCAVGLRLDTVAAEDFCAVMDLDPGWKPDPVTFPQDEIAAFAGAQGSCVKAAAEPEKASEGGKAWYKKPIVWGAAAAGVLVAVLLMGGGSDDNPVDPPLNGFPDPPTN